MAPRGANTAAEFQRQTDKLVNFIATLDADVLGLTELENNFTRRRSAGNAHRVPGGATQRELGADAYDRVHPDTGQFFGGDAISVGFIYKHRRARGLGRNHDREAGRQRLPRPGSATCSARARSVTSSTASTPAAPRLAVTFQEIATDEDFTAVINHFKSKSGNGTGVDADQGDGQGAWQNQRELAAQALTQWIATHPTGTSDNDVLLLGDLNAYLKEDAVEPEGGRVSQPCRRTHRRPAFVRVRRARPARSITGFASNALDAQVTGITEWHVNADEADALDYNLDFDRDPNIFDPNVPVRVSDHDPLLVGIDLAEDPIIFGDDKSNRDRRDPRQRPDRRQGRQRHG